MVPAGTESQKAVKCFCAWFCVVSLQFLPGQTAFLGDMVTAKGLEERTKGDPFMKTSHFHCPY